MDLLDTAEKGKEYMFRINVTAGACANFTNLVVNDTLSGVLKANCTSVCRLMPLLGHIYPVEFPDAERK